MDRPVCALSADQYVVSKLIEAEAKAKWLEETVEAYKKDVINTRKLITDITENMKIVDSEWIGKYITCEYGITEEKTPELFKELATWIGRHEVLREKQR